MAVSGEKYYEKISSIRQNMHESSQIKRSRLHSYLKEINDRGARAKMRNLELLRDVESIEIGMKEYSRDYCPLQQQKADVLKKISRFMEAEKNVGKGLNADKDEATSGQSQDRPLTRRAGAFTNPPAVISMGHQTSRGSDAEAATTSVHSHQALHRSPNRSMHSRERLPSGLLKDCRVGAEDAAGSRAHLSDDISGSDVSPDGCNLSDKHEGTTAALPPPPSIRALTGAPFGRDDEPATSTRPEKGPSPGSGGLAKAETSPAEHSDSPEVAHHPPVMGGGERGRSHLMPQTTFGTEAQDVPGRRGSEDTLSSDVLSSQSPVSDLSISLTQSELDEDAAEGVAPETTGTSSGGSNGGTRHRPDSPLQSDSCKHTPQSSCEPSAPTGTSGSLCQEGFFRLLDHIEGRFGGERTSVYAAGSIDPRQLDRIISLCNRGAALNDEDLEACGAVVLHGIQRLSWSTAKGCLLPEDLVGAHQSSTEPNEISAGLPPDAARLWDRWFKHALLLKERRVLSTERLVQLFTPLLLERHATYSHQAKVLLRTLVSRSSEECPSAGDESDSSSSCGPPPPPPLLADELQSSEEDSQDESPVESVPIRETKAYRLLKQSAMQERLQSSEEEEEEEEEGDSLSGINHGYEEDLGRAKRSSHQDPYPWKEKTCSKAHTGQSKAFWGDSDDGDSEIEAALRPQPFTTSDRDVNGFRD
ncbi:centrosomal protein kizuna isoform 2-T2 [Spinachia spinachia]